MWPAEYVSLTYPHVSSLLSLVNIQSWKRQMAQPNPTQLDSTRLRSFKSDWIKFKMRSLAWLIRAWLGRSSSFGKPSPASQPSAWLAGQCLPTRLQIMHIRNRLVACCCRCCCFNSNSITIMIHIIVLKYLAKACLVLVAFKKEWMQSYFKISFT